MLNNKMLKFMFLYYFMYRFKKKKKGGGEAPQSEHLFLNVAVAFTQMLSTSISNTFVI